MSKSLMTGLYYICRQVAIDLSIDIKVILKTSDVLARNFIKTQKAILW